MKMQKLEIVLPCVEIENKFSRMLWKVLGTGLHPNLNQEVFKIFLNDSILVFPFCLNYYNVVIDNFHLFNEMLLIFST